MFCIYFIVWNVIIASDWHRCCRRHKNQNQHYRDQHSDCLKDTNRQTATETVHLEICFVNRESVDKLRKRHVYCLIKVFWMEFFSSSLLSFYLIASKLVRFSGPLYRRTRHEQWWIGVCVCVVFNVHWRQLNTKKNKRKTNSDEFGFSTYHLGHRIDWYRIGYVSPPIGHPCVKVSRVRERKVRVFRRLNTVRIFTIPIDQF